MSLAMELREAINSTPHRRKWVTLERPMADRLLAKLEGKPDEPAPRGEFSPIEYRILAMLRDANGTVVSAAALVERCNIKTVGSLWAHISRLRKKMARLEMTDQIKRVACDGYYLKRGK